MNITNIGHLSFNARNMEEMKHFYGDILGMTNLFSTTFQELYENTLRKYQANPTPELAAILEYMKANGEKKMIEYFKLADRQFLELFYALGNLVPFGDRRKYYGYYKLNFEVEDIAAMKEHLQRSGVVISRDVSRSVDGSLEISVQDPDGNEVQFTQYSPEALKKLGAEPLTQTEFDQRCSLVRFTTQAAFFVQNPEKMRAFYCQGLGLKNVRTITWRELADAHPEMPELADLAQEHGDSPWLEFLEVAPHQYIELFHTGGQPRKERRELSGVYGYQHICLEVADIHEAWNTVIANGLTPDTAISLGGDRSYQFWLTDPDGNKLELMQYQACSKQMM